MMQKDVIKRMPLSLYDGGRNNNTNSIAVDGMYNATVASMKPWGDDLCGRNASTDPMRSTNMIEFSFSR